MFGKQVLHSFQSLVSTFPTFSFQKYENFKSITLNIEIDILTSQISINLLL